jgi:hypothetical protein
MLSRSIAAGLASPPSPSGEPKNGPFTSRSRGKNANSRPEQQSGVASKQFTEIEERHFYSFCIRLLMVKTVVTGRLRKLRKERL